MTDTRTVGAGIWTTNPSRKKTLPHHFHALSAFWLIWKVCAFGNSKWNPENQTWMTEHSWWRWTELISVDCHAVVSLLIGLSLFHVKVSFNYMQTLLWCRAFDNTRCVCFHYGLDRMSSTETKKKKTLILSKFKQENCTRSHFTVHSTLRSTHGGHIKWIIL